MAIRRKEQKENKLRRKERIDKNRERTVNFLNKSDNLLLIIIVCCFLIPCLLLGSLTIPHAIKEHKLEKLAEEVEECIDNGDFKEARRKANQIIDDSDWSTESEEKWNSIRKSLLEDIDREEVSAGQKIYVGMEQSNMKGKNYTDVVALLKKQGFTNIKTEAITDLITGWITSNGEVEKVTINGSTDFNEKSAVEADAEIVVFYHTFA